MQCMKIHITDSRGSFEVCHSCNSITIQSYVSDGSLWCTNRFVLLCAVHFHSNAMNNVFILDWNLRTS